MCSEHVWPSFRVEDAGPADKRQTAPSAPNLCTPVTLCGLALGIDFVDGRVDGRANFGEFGEDRFREVFRLEDAGGLRSHSDVFQRADIGWLAVDRADQTRKLVALGNERLVEMLGQFAGEPLRFG